MSERTITAARLDRLAALRAQNDVVCAPFLVEIEEIKARMKVALGNAPAEAADLESKVKDITKRTGRTFVGHSLQSVFSSRRTADLDGLERDGLGRYITTKKSVSIRKVGGKK